MTTHTPTLSGDLADAIGRAIAHSLFHVGEGYTVIAFTTSPRTYHIISRSMMDSSARLAEYTRVTPFYYARMNTDGCVSVVNNDVD